MADRLLAASVSMGVAAIDLVIALVNTDQSVTRHISLRAQRHRWTWLKDRFNDWRFACAPLRREPRPVRAHWIFSNFV